MHRQAMLVSLSLSPASTAAKNDKHWAFLDEIDAPQWADLKAEEALARLRTIGDDPWFYRSHSHHEVPLTEITGGHAPDVKDPNAIGRTPHLERKKNRGSSKAKLAFDGAPAVGAKSKESAKEDDSSPRAGYNSSFQDSLSGADSPTIASPVHCKSPEGFSSRRFATSANSDDHVAGNDGAEVLRSSSFRVNMFESQFAKDQTNSEPDVPGSSEACEDEDKPSPPSTHWQETIFSKLKDTSRLRKSLGSALRVKIEDVTENPSSKPPGAVTRPKSRLRQSVQLEVAALPVVNGSDRNTKKDTATLRKDDGLSSRKYKSERTSPGDTSAVAGMANKLGVNSSVQAFEDIRKMRKSWGSALRIKVNNDPPGVEDSNSKHEVPVVPPTSDDCDSDMVLDPPSVADSSKAESEDKILPAIDVTELVRAFERRTHNPREALDSVKELEVFSPKIVAAAGAVRKYRRSVSFDHTPGRGTDSKASTSNPNNPAQPKQGPRASSVSRLNAAAKVDRVSHPSKGGKENTTLHSSVKTSKLNTEPSTGSPRMSRHTVTRTSMPSLTFVAHARAAMGTNGGTILKPSGNGVVETNRLDSGKTAASAVRKSAVWSENGSRKKSEAPVTNAPAKTVSRQSLLRSSMPVFSAAAAAKQASKPVLETGTAGFKQGGKNSSKVVNADADLAALLAEHNRKFRPKPTYEPRIHSQKDIREWESRTGQLFYNLLPVEREKANQEISAAKQTQRPK